MNSETQLALAVERVNEERARVTRQRALVQDLRRKGHDLKLASELLDTFEQALMGARDEVEARRHRLARTLVRRRRKARLEALSA